MKEHIEKNLPDLNNLIDQESEKRNIEVFYKKISEQHKTHKCKTHCTEKYGKVYVVKRYGSSTFQHY